MSKLNLRPRETRMLSSPDALAASPEAVYRAHVEPEIVKSGCSAPTVDHARLRHEAKPGGKIRYE